MAVSAGPWPNGHAMPYYLCPNCLQVLRSEADSPFNWCECGQPLDAVSLLTGTVPLAEHASVRTHGARRFARKPDAAEPVA